MAGKKNKNSNGTPKKTSPKAPPKASPKAPKSPHSPPHPGEGHKSPAPNNPGTPPGIPPVPIRFRFNTVGGIQHFMDEYVPELVLQTVTAVFEQVDEEQRGAVIDRVARVAVENMLVCPAHVLQIARHDEETLTEIVARAIYQDPKWKEHLEEWVAIAMSNVRSAESLVRRSRTRSDADTEDEDSTEEEARPTPRVTPLRMSAACPQCKLKIRNCVCEKPPKAQKKTIVPPKSYVRPPPPPVVDVITSDSDEERVPAPKRKVTNTNNAEKNGKPGRHPEDMAALDYVMDPEKWDPRMSYDEYDRLKRNFRRIYVDIHQSGTVHYSTADSVAQSIFATIAHGQTAGFLVLTKLLERLRTVAITPGIKQAQIDHIQSLIPSPSDDVPVRFAKAREEQAKIAAKIAEERDKARPRPVPTTFRGRGYGNYNTQNGPGTFPQTRGGHAYNTNSNSGYSSNNFGPTRGRGSRGM